MSIIAKLEELGLSLPEIPENLNSYTPVVSHGGQAFVSGQLAKQDGTVLHRGRVGESVTIEEAQQAARVAVLNLLAQLENAVGLDNVEQFLKLQVYVAAAADFAEHPKVANAASDLLVEIFGSAGNHTRTAFGCYSLPQNASVEIDAVLAVKE